MRRCAPVLVLHNPRPCPATEACLWRRALVLILHREAAVEEGEARGPPGEQRVDLGVVHALALVQHLARHLARFPVDSARTQAGKLSVTESPRLVLGQAGRTQVLSSSPAAFTLALQATRRLPNPIDRHRNTPLVWASCRERRA